MEYIQGMLGSTF